jgi:hypothetical protein
MLLVQLGINSTRDVWKFAKLDSPGRLVQFSYYIKDRTIGKANLLNFSAFQLKVSLEYRWVSRATISIYYSTSVLISQIKHERPWYN